MRFRRLEDEQRYLALRTELYLRVAEALREQPVICQEILRNLGKIEHVAFYEGVEQGAVASFFAMELDEEEFLSMSAADMHRRIYAHHDTPLTEAERSPWIALSDALRQEDTPAPDEQLVYPQLLVAPRAEYVPLTLKEVEGTAVPIAGVRRPRQAPPTPLPTDAEHQANLEWLRTHPGEEDALGLASETDDDDLRAFEEILRAVPHTADPELGASPQMLDRIRDALVTRTRAGWKPEEWKDVILAVMQDTSIPAYTVDAQLATPQGETVLQQAGLFDVKPSPWSALAALEQLGVVDSAGDPGETPGAP